MKARIAASVAAFAALCGSFLVPTTAAAQLRCRNAETDTLIRSVSFDGNESFSDAELALHVYATETDFFRRGLSNSKAVIGTATALGLGFGLTREPRLQNALIWGGAGIAVGYGISQFRGVARCLNPGTLTGDMVSLAGFYREQGFRDVRVDTSTTVEGRWVDVGFRIVEGKPVLVDSLNIVGFDTVALGPLPKNLNSRPGGRYSPTLTQEDVDSLETRLRDNGYPNGRVDRSSKLTSSYLANVDFLVTPGARARIGEIRVERNTLEGRQQSIDSSVVLSLLRFRSGDLYSERALDQAMRRLYAVRTFLSAEVAPDLSRVPKGDTIVDVRVIVTEDLMRSGTVEPAVGTLDCLRVRGNYTDKAFLRGTNRLDVSASLSKIGLAKPTQAGALYDACRWLRDLPNDETDPSISALNYSANVSLTRPLPLPGGLLPSVSAYRERRGAYQAYLRTTLIGGALSVNKLITRNIAFEGSYNLEYGNTKAAPTVLCFLFRACDEASREQIADSNRVLAVIGTRFSRDRRNSADSASDGGFVRLDLRAASPLILSDKSLTFQKGVIDAAWYQRMGPGVVAVRARAGLIGGGQATDFARFAPPQERLYVGGENSVRGFRQNELGPVIYVTSNDSSRAQAVIDAPTETIRDSLLQAMTVRVIPTGGNAMYVGNLEYRLSLPFVRGLQTVAFLDVGALSQSGIQTINGSNQFRFTPGVAIKYFSPVGPVQINFGYNKYNPVAGAVYSDQFTDASGQAFLKCLREESPGGRCLPLPAIAPQTKWFRRITLSVAFPPDF